MQSVYTKFLKHFYGELMHTNNNSADVLENCENLITKDSEAMMVTTRSAKDKLHMNDIDLTIGNELDDDDVNVDEDEHDEHNNNNAK